MQSQFRKSITNEGKLKFYRGFEAMIGPEGEISPAAGGYIFKKTISVTFLLQGLFYIVKLFF